MPAINRRHDIDCLRVIAIGLLLIYHISICFQSWGIMIGFITSEKQWMSLWTPMTALNIWRIPFLFFVAGMGVCFSLQNRSIKQLLQERAARILLPFLFGFFVIVPVHVFLWQRYYHWDIGYAPGPGHLWFLGNIFAYTVLLSPLFFYLKRNEEGKLAVAIKKLFSHPIGLLFVIAAFIAEAIIVDPHPYEFYAMSWHGFILGLLAFLFGFFFILSGDRFWPMMVKWRWLFIAFALSFYIYRLLQFQMSVPDYQLSVESDFWIFSVFSFGYRYLNRPSRIISYLSEAAYPVYIMHMIFLFLGAWIIFPLAVPVQVQFILVILFTFTGCLAFYELIIKRVNIIRPLFGLKMKGKTR